MFTGIIQGVSQITEVNFHSGLLRFSVSLTPTLLANLKKGASISIDGVCLTVISFDDSQVYFDAIEETLQRSTLKSLKNGDLVNVERAACIGDEIGGHLLSGHVYGTARIIGIENLNKHAILSLQCEPEWTKYLFPKGFIAINGASLTLVDVAPKEGLFTVHLIPETLRETTFGNKKEGDLVNIELDAHTQAIVDTVERSLLRYANISTS